MRRLLAVCAALQLAFIVPAQAQEDLKAYKAFMAKTAISLWGALPVIVDSGADVGTYYAMSDIGQEQPASRGTDCYFDRRLEAPFERPTIEMSIGEGISASAKAGIPLRNYMTEIGLGASYESAHATAFRLDQISIEGPGTTWPLTDAGNLNDSPQCASLKQYLAGQENGILVFRTISAALLIATQVDAEVAAGLDAQLGSATTPLGGVTVKLVDAGNRFLLMEGPKTVIAIQPYRLDARKVAEIHIYFREHPESRAELQMLVDNYLDGTDPDFLERQVAAIRGWLERNEWAGETLQSYSATLFEGAGAMSMDDLRKENAYPSSVALETAGYVAAAIVIGQDASD